jgi:hypothetical protein
VQIDHVVFAGPDLAAACGVVSAALGVDPTPGGQHVGLGTRNWLLDLGNGAYLEIIGPDPDQPEPAAPRPFGIDALSKPGLVAWALRSFDIARDIATAHAAGIELGEVISMQRQRPDGTMLRWRLTTPRAGLLPFLIDWGDTPHPAVELPRGPRLSGMRLETSAVAGWEKVMAAFGCDAAVVHGLSERLVATVVVGHVSMELV